MPSLNVTDTVETADQKKKTRLKPELMYKLQVPGNSLQKIHNIQSNKYAETMSILPIIRTARLNGLPSKKAN